MRNSKTLEKLRNNEVALSAQIGSAYAPFVGIAALAGYDCIWLDAEHKANSEEQLRECILTATCCDCDTVVRIRKRGYLDHFRPLEDGATGIMVPHCMSAKEAAFAVRNSKYYPVGLRGMDFTGLACDYGVIPSQKAVQHALKNNFTMLQIEDVEALEELDAIAAVEGVDILFVGPSDLTQSAKKAGIYTEKFLDDVYARVQKIVETKDNLWWGTTVSTLEAAQHVYDYGARFINLGGDFKLIYEGFPKLVEAAKKLGK